MLTDAPTSFAFEMSGKFYFFLARNSPQEDYLTLRAKLIVYYRMTDFDDKEGIYRCVMESDDGKKVVMHFRQEDVFANMHLVGDVMDTSYAGLAA